jgi:hypothetical protein
MIINDLAEIATKVLIHSSYLSFKGVEPGACLDLIAYKIAEHINANYHLTKRDAWYGIDIDAKIKELRQEIAIAYSYKRKFGSKTPDKPKPEADLFRGLGK